LDTLTDSVIVSSETKSLFTTISRLTANSQFRGQVFALNQVGCSNESKTVFFQTKEAPPDKSPIIVSVVPTGANSVKIVWKVSRLGFF
jgi:hypothetical protein